MRGQYFSPKKLESLADDLLDRYERECGSTVQPPIQAESIAESIGLNILWDEIPEEPGTTTHGALIPEKRLIVLNESRLQLLESTQGLYNTTIAHEIGHWVLNVDHAALDHASLPELAYDTSPAPESRVLVTANIRDFEPLLRERAGESRTHPGMILIPSSVRNEDFGVLISGVQKTIADTTQETWVNRVEWLRRA